MCGGNILKECYERGLELQNGNTCPICNSKRTKHISEDYKACVDLIECIDCGNQWVV